MKSNGCHPATGDPASLSDIRRVALHYSEREQTYICPVLGKRFNSSTHIVAVLPSNGSRGTVYSYEAVSQLNFKTKDYSDLLTGEPFTRDDVLTVQDPSSRPMSSSDLYSVKHGLKRPSSIKHSDAHMQWRGDTGRLLASVQQAPLNNSALHKSTPASNRPSHTYRPDASTCSSAANVQHKAVASDTVNARSATFTSTSVAIRRNANGNDSLPKRRRAQLPSEDGHIRLHTTFGVLDIEVKCQSAPMTCERFLELIEASQFDHLRFDRLMPQYMLEVSNARGQLYSEERQEKLKHERGTLSTSAERQHGFFVTLRGGQQHLDMPQRRMTPFASIVGGFETLAAIEAVGPTDADNSFSLNEPVQIDSAEVFHNPFRELDERKQREVKQQREQAERGRWFTDAGASRDVGNENAPPGRKYIRR